MKPYISERLTTDESYWALTAEEKIEKSRAHEEDQIRKKDEAERLIGELLLKRGIQISVDGCGCCDSPSLDVMIDGILVYSSGNASLNNIDQSLEPDHP